MQNSRIRNFCIIAHIDHGKSTLADRFLELTKIIKKGSEEQILDTMDLERERGITIKMQPVRMHYADYILNLIDTPGHTDFSYEVSRAMSAVEGAILLVDATKGIQAQTVANLELAKREKLEIIPVINKIDLPNARTAEIKNELANLVDANIKSILVCSAKTGEGVDKLLEAIINRIPGPIFEEGRSSIIFDSYYDEYQGVIAHIRVFGEKIKKGNKMFNTRTGKNFEIKECGYLQIKKIIGRELNSGEIGYIKTGLKSVGECAVGDFISNEIKNQKSPCPPIASNGVAGGKIKNNVEGFKKPKPKIFADIFPFSSEHYPLLVKSLERLSLNDASFSFNSIYIQSLGSGFQIGCLGLLHLEIIQERLEREYGLELIVTQPTVKYQKGENGQWQEPWVKLDIISPAEYFPPIMEEMKGRRAILLKISPSIQYEIPLSEIITDFHDRLKSISQGYGSFFYKNLDYRSADLIQLDIYIAEERYAPLSHLVHRSKIEQMARDKVKKLKEAIPRQLFEVKVQAKVGGKIIASEHISPLRKDVTAKLYGGDVTRKKKLIEKQKRGKKKMMALGKIRIPPRNHSKKLSCHDTMKL